MKITDSEVFSGFFPQNLVSFFRNPLEKKVFFFLSFFVKIRVFILIHKWNMHFYNSLSKFAFSKFEIFAILCGNVDTFTILCRNSCVFCDLLAKLAFFVIFGRNLGFLTKFACYLQFFDYIHVLSAILWRYLFFFSRIIWEHSCFPRFFHDIHNV